MPKAWSDPKRLSDCSKIWDVVRPRQKLPCSNVSCNVFRKSMQCKVWWANAALCGWTCESHWAKEHVWAHANAAVSDLFWTPMASLGTSPSFCRKVVRSYSIRIGIPVFEMHQLSKSIRMWTSWLTKLARKSTKDLHAPIVPRWILQVLKSTGWILLRQSPCRIVFKFSGCLEFLCDIQDMYIYIYIYLYPRNPPAAVHALFTDAKRGRSSRKLIIIATFLV